MEKIKRIPKLIPGKHKYFPQLVHLKNLKAHEAKAKKASLPKLKKVGDPRKVMGPKNFFKHKKGVTMASL